MVQRSTIELTLLDSTYRVSSSDPKWLDLVRILWEPFVRLEVAGSDEMVQDIAVDPSSEGVTFKDDDGAPTTLASPWEVVSLVCDVLFEGALIKAATFFDLHAGVVVRDGEALLLAGDSGVGKTTLVLELLSRRPEWTYYSDDLAPIRDADGLIEAFPKPLSIKDRNRWGGVSGRWPVPGWVASPEDAFRAPPSIFGRYGGPPVPAGRLYFLERSAEPEAEVFPLTAAEATLRCLPYAGRPGKRTLTALARLCRQTPAFRLTSNKPESAAEILRDLG